GGEVLAAAVARIDIVRAAVRLILKVVGAPDGAVGDGAGDAAGSLIARQGVPALRQDIVAVALDHAVGADAGVRVAAGAGLTGRAVKCDGKAGPTVKRAQTKQTAAAIGLAAQDGEEIGGAANVIDVVRFRCHIIGIPNDQPARVGVLALN